MIDYASNAAVGISAGVGVSGKTVVAVSLHNQQSQVLKVLLLLRGNQRIIVINIPWYL